TFVVYRVRVGHEGRSPPGGGTPLPGAISPAETGEIRARGEARRSEVDQSILQGMVRFGDVNVADKLCATSRCRKAIIPEVGERDPSGALALDEEKPCDQVAGEHEKDVHSDESPADSRHIRVKRDDEQHGERAQPFDVLSEFRSVLIGGAHDRRPRDGRTVSEVSGPRGATRPGSVAGRGWSGRGCLERKIKAGSDRSNRCTPTPCCDRLTPPCDDQPRLTVGPS